MRDDNLKKTKFSWPKSLVRKWFNIRSRNEEFHADCVFNGGGDTEEDTRHSFSEREPWGATKKSITEKLHSTSEQRRIDLDHPRIIDIQNYSIFVATWNVGGRPPPCNLPLEDWLHTSAPADLYVLGFQEIVPLNAGNVLGAEDNGPAKKWHALIRRALNSIPGGGGGGGGGGEGSYTPSPAPAPVAEENVDFEGRRRERNRPFFERRSFQTAGVAGSWRGEGGLERRLSVCDRVFFGHRRSDGEGSWRRPSDYSRWGSSEEDYGGGEGESPSTVLFGGRGRYCLVASKQMVGILLTVWVRSELREFVGNMKVSCVGRGLMGYLGNKGSISVSMMLHETNFCFVCTHLTSGEKEGDELRRNSDVVEILRKTRFPKVRGRAAADDTSPQTILEHDRVIWLGDLNYRIGLTYRSAKALVEMQNWRVLLEKDQLRVERRRGRVFEGWKEGRIYFPPTYKYSTNSDRYTGDESHPKEKKRTPAWCDRILWRGEGLYQLTYVRAESRFSDHRPVYGIFCAEVQSVNSRSGSGVHRPSSRLAEDYLPHAHGYTELSFF